MLKAEAAGLLHKSEHRAVRTGLRSGDEVYAAAQDLLERLGQEFDGVSLQVQAHAAGHREVLLGMTRDPRYGPLYAAGLGGVQVELLRDGSIIYKYQFEGQITILSSDSVLHWKDKGNGVIGMSRIDFMASTISVAIEAQNHTERSYRKSGKRPGVFMID